MFMQFRHHKHDDDGDETFTRGPWRRWVRHGHGPFAFIFGERHGRRARRGDVKFIVLAALSERPMHGYDVMKSLEERHQGRYRMSPGSVYPTLQMLEDGGFVTGELVDGKRVFTITEAGKKLLADHHADAETDDDDDDLDDWSETRDTARRFFAAARQGIMHHDPRIRDQVRAIVDDARKKIYKLLAEEK